MKEQKQWFTKRLFALARVCIVLAVLMFASLPSYASSSFQNPLQNPLMSFNNDQVKQQGILASVLNHDDTLSSCKPTGQISDARCDYETVEMDINSANFFPILDKLRREKYFRLYKVDLYKDCPFWNDNSLCMSRDCTVSKVEEEEIPTEYRSLALSSIKTTNERDYEDDLLGSSSAQSLPHNHQNSKDTCQCAESDFCHWEDEEWSPESSWVDLLDNPERFTGYAGASARKVWTAIYEENCFGVARAVGASMTSSAGSPYDVRIKSARLGDPGSASAAAEALSSLLTGQSSPLDSSSSESEQCLEKRVFYKIISGLHASISIHICHDYLDQQSGEWKPNLSCFVERIAQHPDRLQNLYFTHTVLVRSLAKLAERVGMKPTKGLRNIGAASLASQAKQLSKLAPNLPASSSPATVNLASLLLQAINAPPTFDEESMFDEEDPESEFLRREFRDRFRNVSRIMDCVGCDKCRLWGKLQINGVGTALKVLFDANELSPQRLLQRSELVALINTVHRVSESIRAVETFRTLYQSAAQKVRKEEILQEDKVTTQFATSNNLRINESHNSHTKDNGKKQESDHSHTQGAWHRIFTLLDAGKRQCEEKWSRCFAWVLWLANGGREESNHKKIEL
ncbi:hypothetical protein L7F22_039092 [Adiantum nelumboides]|nr:hypothetical protein [Adiantum nelumboides]